MYKPTPVVDFNEIFVYDETSKSCLRWKYDVFCGRTGKTPCVKAGEEVGSMDSKGYWETKLKGRHWRIHRIIWAMLVEHLESHQKLDHKDGVRTNNKLGNLRRISNKGNMQNCKKSSKNTSGVTGVRKEWHRGVLYWGAWWREGDKEVSKIFSTRKYGDEEAFKLACETRIQMIAKLNEQGENYTERHGT